MDPSQGGQPPGGPDPETASAIEQIMGMLEELGQGMQMLQQQLQQSQQQTEQAVQEVASENKQLVTEFAKIQAQFGVLEKSVSQQAGFEEQAQAGMMDPAAGGAPMAGSGAGMF
jgi:prefoldin subunit 5